ncbi:transport and Golgi organization protein 6 homolog [Salvelinus fontinalis]|uniref:transport and Golgi organization protein 6 homolog n=1 Tax=Salvelinus fontinalis TaxID=8038 RepID=UPI0024850E35|nr:transport and Golgi organization protein 6 homolog [Salvelinus fontinalis]
MTSAILSALSVLTKPIGETTVHGTQHTEQEALMAALQANQDLLEERLQGENGLYEVRSLREEVRAGVPWICTDTEDVTWSFVQECLLLLLSLARNLTLQLELFNQAPSPAMSRLRTPEMAPPLPPDVLSVAQQKTLGAALQFVVSLGLCPYLALGVGVPLGRRSAFGKLVEGLVCHDVAPVPERRLLTTTAVLLELCVLSSLATMVYTRHLGDVMAALCQLGYRPHRPEKGTTKEEKEISKEERKNCRKALQKLLGKVYQPIVIKELLILQGGPKQAPPGPGTSGGNRSPLSQAPPWLRRLCGQVLSERLMQPNGVQSVVRAILEGGAGGESDWRKCDGVARILAACPQQSLSSDSYYSQVCPQILELLHFRDKLTAQQFQRVATRAALTMVQDCPMFALQYLLTPLFSSLHRCGRMTGEGQTQVTVEEWELTRCAEDVFKICVVGNSPSAPLLKALGEVIPVLFDLYCFTKKNASHLRAPCQEILLWYFGKSELPVALSTLQQLCAMDGGAGGVASGFHFTPGSDGGAQLNPSETISDEDDALYEKVSGEQWRVECLAQLLAEMKDSDLPGDFFLELLQALTCWAAEEEEEEQEVDTSAMTLLQLEQHLLGKVTGRGQKLALLQVLAVMCEGLPHTLLLRKPTQVVEFIMAMLQRTCVGLDQVRAAASPVETQTLSMGMGLVATLLSGPSPLSAEDYSSMSRLLPPLKEISQRHPEVVIQELASDLRAAIATHGAYQPDNVTRATQYQSPKMDNNVPTKKNFKTQTSPSQVSQTRLYSPTLHNNPSTHTTQTPNTRAPIQTCIPNLRTQSSSGDSLAQKTYLSQRVSSGAGQGPAGVSAPDGGQSGGRGGSSSSSEPSSGTPSRAFSDCLLGACDPEVPTRAVALRTLTRAIQNGDREALQNQEKVLTLFLENLEHEDTFVYLSAIQGLAVLADFFPERILLRLQEEYQNGPSSQKERSLETRLKVGEVLMRASRAMGDLAPHHGRPLIGVFLRGTRDEDRSVRASCLSNLGELCQRLNYALGPWAQELSTCLTALIKTEKEAEVRRAAVHVISLLLRGLSDKATEVLSDVLLDLYRALKWVVRSDTDDVTVLHAQLALEDLDDVMRRFIFPAQKLEKKIVVLP